MQTINIIETDQMMDEGDGWFVLQEARRQHPAVPVVLLSAAPAQVPTDIAQDVAFDAVLLKPVETDRLLDTLTILSLSAETRNAIASAAQWNHLHQLAMDGDVTGIEEWLLTFDTGSAFAATVREMLQKALWRLDFSFMQWLSRTVSPASADSV